MTNQPLAGLVLALSLLVATTAAAQRAVTVNSVDELATTRTLQYPARVVNLQLADIAAETSGRIVHFPVEVGDRVQAGQLLMEIDCDSARIDEKRIQAGLKRLLAARDLTVQQLDRARRLVQSNSISREELDQRQTQLNADDASIEEQRAQLESARLAIQRCRLNAPYAGTVVNKMGHAGGYATPGAAQLTLLREDAVEVEVSLPLAVVEVLRRAGDTRFVIDDHPYPLRLRSILPLIDARSLQQRVRLSIDGPTKPPGGGFGRVVFSTARNYLPAQVIEKRDGRFGVFVFEQNQARFVPLQNVEEGQPVAVELAHDTLIITSDLKLLNDQDSVSLEP